MLDFLLKNVIFVETFEQNRTRTAYKEKENEQHCNLSNRWQTVSRKTG